MHSLTILLLAGASVAFLHAILPDHWLPIAVLARAQKWSLARTITVTMWTTLGHVVGSLFLGTLVMILGVGLGSFVRKESLVVGSILILTGLGSGLWGLWKARRPLAEHGHSPSHDDPRTNTLPPHSHPHSSRPLNPASRLIPLGMAASPDPAILPVILAAAALGIIAAIQVFIVYTVVTIGSTVLLTAGTAWGYQAKWPWLERHADYVTAAVLVGLGLVTLAAW